jgi:hypothetical protein
MTCPKCKFEQPDSSLLCSQCAEPLTASTPRPADVEEETIVSRSNKDQAWFALLGGVCILVAKALIGRY